MMIRVAALSLAGIVALLSGAANAAPNCSSLPASEGCTCVVDLVEGGLLAELTDVSGGVQKTADGGYTPVTSSTPIKIGDGVYITEGKGVLTAGPSCQLMSLGPQTSIIAKEVGGCGCIQVSNLKPPVTLADTLKLGLGIADTAGLINQSQQNENEPVSP
jgi:hypothetical protein